MFGLVMTRGIFLAIAAFFTALAGPAAARVSIRVDTSLADQTLALTCSGQAVDEAAVRASPVVQAQVRHNSGINAAATMDAYVAALRGAAACQAPTPDAFGIGDVIAHRDVYRAKIDALKARQGEIERTVSAMLEPYIPSGADFSGDVVLAVPYFSCGGFATGAHFFIDLRCLDPNFDNDANAVMLLVAHETYHVIQDRDYFDVIEDPGDVRTTNQALEVLFSSLLWEGTAEYVAKSSTLAAGGGPYSRLMRTFAQNNGRRLPINFALTTILFEHVAAARDPRKAIEDAYRIGFSGSGFEQMGYYVGAKMAADIETIWGREALLCVMRLPPEQFVLAHAAVAPADGPALGPAATDAARRLARTRRHTGDFSACRPRT